MKMPPTIHAATVLFVIILNIVVPQKALAQFDITSELFELNNERKIASFYKKHLAFSIEDSAKYYSAYNSIDEYNQECEKSLQEALTFIQSYNFEYKNLIAYSFNILQEEQNTIMIKQLFRKDTNILELGFRAVTSKDERWHSITPIYSRIKSSPSTDIQQEYIRMEIDSTGYGVFLNQVKQSIAEENYSAFQSFFLTQNILDSHTELHERVLRKMKRLIDRYDTTLPQAWRTLKAMNTYNLANQIHYYYEWQRDDEKELNSIGMAYLNSKDMEQQNYNQELITIVGIELEGKFYLVSVKFS